MKIRFGGFSLVETVIAGPLLDEFADLFHQIQGNPQQVLTDCCVAVRP